MVTLTFWDLLVRLAIASLCGGLIGIERGRKHRAAGFRTHMLVCMGAALTMVLSTYLAAMLAGEFWHLDAETTMVNTDVSRFGAQVINGIGFIGAGTIIVTGRQQVKGMTTAAGFWACACMGIAVGAGFYEAALIGVFLIVITVIFLSKLEAFAMSRARSLNLYMEIEHIDDLSQVIECIKEQNVNIFDVEITKPRPLEDIEYPRVIFTLRLPKKQPHTVFLMSLAQLPSVRSMEEL